jgi:RimJ/RimL family protein N-acetyltransferase
MPIAPLEPADIPEVMRIERLPGYDAVMGRWSAEEHAAQMAASDTAYFGLRRPGGLAGFAILQSLGAPAVMLRRIAVENVGRGGGTRLLRAVMDHAFETTDAQALNLEVAHGNPRARTVYRREGFETQGRDELHVLMSVDRARWAGLRGR